jgi:NAD-dependent deacetylase
MRQDRVEIPAGLVDRLRRAKRVAALTGAGISAESGVPTFREAQTGLWARFDPQELATPQAFQRDPRLVWSWYAWRRELVAKAQPNPGHLALVEMEKRFPNFTLVTQNVDGLHRLAGSQAVIELHGNIRRTKCFQEGCIVETWAETGEAPPRCPQCGGPLRPDVVWFGEALPERALAEAYAAARACEVFFSIGTSALVQPAASLPLLALEAGAVVVEVNPDDTPLTQLATFSLRGPAGVVLPQLVRETWKLTGRTK